MCVNPELLAGFEGAPKGLICTRPRASRQRYQRPILRDRWRRADVAAVVAAAQPTVPAFGDVGRSFGARMCTLNLPGELAWRGSLASDLARVCKCWPLPCDGAAWSGWSAHGARARSRPVPC